MLVGRCGVSRRTIWYEPRRLEELEEKQGKCRVQTNGLPLQKMLHWGENLFFQGRAGELIVVVFNGAIGEGAESLGVEKGIDDRTCKGNESHHEPCRNTRTNATA